MENGTFEGLKQEIIQKRLVEKLVLASLMQTDNLDEDLYRQSLGGTSYNFIRIPDYHKQLRGCDRVKKYSIKIGDLTGRVITTFDTFTSDSEHEYPRHIVKHDCELGDVFRGTFEGTEICNPHNPCSLDHFEIEILKYIPGKWEEQLEGVIREYEEENEEDLIRDYRRIVKNFEEGKR